MVSLGRTKRRQLPKMCGLNMSLRVSSRPEIARSRPSALCHKPTFLEAMELTKLRPPAPVGMVEVKKRKKPRRGGRGLFGFLWGNHDGRGKPHQIVMFSTPCRGRDN
jgi:hypothetical protein